MAYATLATMAERFGVSTLVALTDRAEVATGQIDMDVLDRALADASAVVDSYIADRHTVPLTVVPTLIEGIVAAIAYWHLHIGQPDQKAHADYERALRHLRDIADGRASISTASGAVPPTHTGPAVLMTETERPLRASTMRGLI